ncbi:hypothetical protein [Clostridium thermobutyricum]|uniref:Uncharacterized protein n=1 Tax=Clostridium thermobutyricum DSM 4928 TaxID=1121339 RepID=A0A1V4ST45_9CLOT|nr:hypothetical protein [Clostridium thermobutyricum]OPX46963.1 hypothetical protein CLTHE_22000 [Clostridium thermobutyricum DSM 4928]
MNELNNESFKQPEENLNTTKEKLNLKLITIVLSSVLLIGILFSFTTLSYKSLVVNFKNYFDNAHYSTANNLVVTKGNMNILKSFKINNDLTSYFKDKLKSITEKLNNGEITSDEALVIINEINRYNLLDKEIDETVGVLSNNISSSSTLTKGISEYQKKNFKEALTIFKSIPSNNEGYNTAATYIPKCKEEYTNYLLKEVDTLVAEHYYSKSITLLEENLELLDNSTKISDKIEELKTARDKYIQERDGK